ncbi:MAG: hypothetical protein F4194_00275 [Acidimicrobiia bacterium]|nr:hypothetical protein [Acidimicrobiia bacterium]MYH04915.1 hypothetical protein [Acidimicrobiia bacterium]MYK56228.1 hypothetical protein [Acidimicrobiia bacterium]
MDDPGVVDRRFQPVTVPEPRSFPSRPMTIHGLEGRPAAWILSRDGSGPSTRLLEVPPGWGTRLRGCFTGDVEVFVLSGRVDADGHALGVQTLWGARAGTVVSGFGSTEGASLLLFSGAPLRFMPGEGNEDQRRPAPVVAGERGWIRMPGAPSNSRQRELAPSLRGGVFWQTAAIDLNLDRWYVDDEPTEVFVLEGSWRQADRGRHGVEVVEFPKEGYFYRPAGVWHGGASTGTATVALLLIRAGAVPSRHDDAPGEYPGGLR